MAISLTHRLLRRRHYRPIRGIPEFAPVQDLGSGAGDSSRAGQSTRSAAISNGADGIAAVAV
jgi:hypothetical protein